MIGTSINILAILRHYFKMGFKASETTYRIQEEERNETISVCTTQDLCENFQGDDSSLEIKASHC